MNYWQLPHPELRTTCFIFQFFHHSLYEKCQENYFSPSLIWSQLLLTWNLQFTFSFVTSLHLLNSVGYHAYDSAYEILRNITHSRHVGQWTISNWKYGQSLYGVFTYFTILSPFCTIWGFLSIPDTRGQSLLKIEEIFEKKWHIHIWLPKL